MIISLRCTDLPPHIRCYTPSQGSRPSSQKASSCCTVELARQHPLDPLITTPMEVQSESARSLLQELDYDKDSLGEHGSAHCYATHLFWEQQHQMIFSGLEPNLRVIPDLSMVNGYALNETLPPLGFGQFENENAKCIVLVRGYMPRLTTLPQC